MQANKIIIITAPSGAGKTSITHYLLNKHSSLAFSVSATTRPPRGNEQHGIDYYFINTQSFQQHIHANDFIEWEMVYEGKYYGTLKSELQRIWHENKIPLLDIDVQGAIHVQQQFPGASLSIFIKPPSVDVLRERLQRRGTETEQNIATRLGKAAYELSFTHAFNAVIVNDDFDTACAETENVIKKFLGEVLCKEQKQSSL